MNTISDHKQEEMAQLEAQVRGRLVGLVRDLHLLAREGGLVLQGRAPTYYAKQLAQHRVMEATRIPILANEIEVGAQIAATQE